MAHTIIINQNSSSKFSVMAAHIGATSNRNHLHKFTITAKPYTNSERSGVKVKIREMTHSTDLTYLNCCETAMDEAMHAFKERGFIDTIR